ncbi:MAG TPA: TIGR04283 family arsenosugar biosynthesis glycosyltransferase [Polyangiaceae bacterium]|nr:TIGR04283 family arsenosugar biosynthesis glycosyltransferase [Polyangiaceae bacterium]
MKLSVVIPTWCEAPRIAKLVAHCRSFTDEVIVADAHSPDDTAAAAGAAGALVVQTEKGRGTQLNAGARRSTGDVLLFVHADTTIPASARQAIAEALALPAIIGGNFKLRFVPETPMARFYSRCNHARRKLFAMYYGDSCIFVRRRVFDELGGFRNLPVFEDHDFVSRLERLGQTHYEVRVQVESSARRFERRPLRTLALWTLMQTLYASGVSPERLSRLYADAR